MEDIVHVLKSQEDIQLVLLKLRGCIVSVIAKRCFHCYIVREFKLCLVVHCQGDCLNVDKLCSSYVTTRISSQYQLHWVHHWVQNSSCNAHHVLISAQPQVVSTWRLQASHKF